MWERLKVSAEAYAIRGRGLSRTAVQLLGIGAVLLGAYNFLLEPFVVASVVLPIYREVILGVLAIVFLGPQLMSGGGGGGGINPLMAFGGLL